MSRASRWIKIYEQMLDSDVWMDEEPFNYRDAFIHVLISANWKPGVSRQNGHVININRGQWLTSIRKLGSIFHWDKRRVYKWLKYMETTNMITSENVEFGTLLTVVNYDKFQGGGDTPTHEVTHTPAHEVTYEDAHIDTHEDAHEDTYTPTHTPAHEVTPRSYKEEYKKETEDRNASINAREAGSGPEAVPAQSVGAGAAGSDPDQADDDDDDEWHDPEEMLEWDFIHACRKTSLTSPEASAQDGSKPETK